MAAYGFAKAATLLAGKYTLVATNVPYLGRGKQSDELKRYCEQLYPDAKADLATCFVERCLAFCAQDKVGRIANPSHGTVALVTPQNWLFLGTYKKLRKRLLEDVAWNVVARLGPRAFETISGEVVNVALLTLTCQPPLDEHELAGLDASAEKNAADKAAAVRETRIATVGQKGQLGNPNAKVSFDRTHKGTLLSDYADAPRGVVSGDRDFWVKAFWELGSNAERWRPLQSAVSSTIAYGGRETVIDWCTSGRGMLRPGVANTSYQKRGVAMGQVRELSCTLYTGELYDNSAFAIVPRNPDHLPAIWAFCSSAEYNSTVRRSNQKLSVDPSHLLQVPFDLAHWQQVAAEKYPNGLPKPYSSDPTQWLFDGYPAGSDDPLQVAVARLLGYRWPRQTGSSFPDCPALGPDGLESLADRDGLVPIPSVRGEPPAAERLQELLRAAGAAASLFNRDPTAAILRAMFSGR